jgi:hypothetical protein
VETIIAIVVVAIALVWATWRIFCRPATHRADDGCGSGCCDCSCAGPPQPEDGGERCGKKP